MNSFFGKLVHEFLQRKERGGFSAFFNRQRSAVASLWSSWWRSTKRAEEEMKREMTLKAQEAHKHTMAMEIMKMKQELAFKEQMASKVAEFESKLESRHELPMCQICLDADLEHALIPCGHQLCGSCVKQLQTICPFCNAPIKDNIRLYF